MQGYSNRLTEGNMVVSMLDQFEGLYWANCVERVDVRARKHHLIVAIFL